MFKFEDIKIGDIVETTNNEIGKVISINSIAFLNDKRKREKSNMAIAAEMMPFVYDDKRHPGVWYPVVTIVVEKKNGIKTDFHLVGLDFVEIKRIIEESVPEKTFLEKVAGIFKK